MDQSSYPALLSPFALAGKMLRNRVMHVAMSTRLAVDRTVTDEIVQYHVNRAAGGAAVIVTEPLGMMPHQRDLPRPQVVTQNLDGFSRWAAQVEAHDCRLIGQLQDSGRGRHYPGRTHNAQGASALPDDLSWTVPRAMEIDAIRTMIGDIAEAARLLQRSGFSGIEISAGHGHLFHQFLSPWSNRRTDLFGGDWEGRARFVAELIAGIRDLCGAGFIIGLKLPGDDGVPGSIALPEATIITAMLTGQRQADYVGFCQGAHAQTLEMHVPDRYGDRLPHMDLVRQLRAAAGGTPLVAFGRITDPAEAERVVRDGDADLVGLGRPLVADPAWLLKAASNRAFDVRYCISCNTCWGTIISHQPIACVNNPRVGKADEMDFWPQPSGLQRRVTVVGGGVAGLEAAWVAAARGHHVTLFGASEELGGRARLRVPLPGGETITSIYDYQHTAAVRAGVTFKLGRLADFAEIAASRPDAVVLACGSDMIPPDWLPPDEQALVPDLRAAMRGLVGVTQRQRGKAVIFDTDHTEATYAAAEMLTHIFDQVIIMTPRDTVATDMQLVTRQGVLRRLAERRINVIPSSTPIWSAGFEDGMLDYANVFTGERGCVEDVSFLSYSTPRVPMDALATPLRQAGMDVHLVGDCQTAADLLSATATGHAIGMAL
ncbi:NAD(P)-binding protein [Acidisphaera sp. L21]|uniref:oxidoreductase n=1 Tax=Acidisphaera sp. L21 TaxID=1641851 RepID=UPI00131C3544|nr:NAD(P)-binding protein [Acidisphaera sp. L21]